MKPRLSASDHVVLVFGRFQRSVRSHGYRNASFLGFRLKEKNPRLKIEPIKVLLAISNKQSPVDHWSSGKTPPGNVAGGKRSGTTVEYTDPGSLKAKRSIEERSRFTTLQSIAIDRFPFN